MLELFLTQSQVSVVAPNLSGVNACISRHHSVLPQSSLFPLIEISFNNIAFFVFSFPEGPMDGGVRHAPSTSVTIGSD